jgi:hypothetical protein
MPPRSGIVDFLKGFLAAFVFAFALEVRAQFHDGILAELVRPGYALVSYLAGLSSHVDARLVVAALVNGLLYNAILLSVVYLLTVRRHNRQSRSEG